MKLLTKILHKTLLSRLSSLSGKFQRLASSVIETERFESVYLINESMLEYNTNSPELCKLEEELKKMQENCEEIPIVINGKEMKSETVRYQVLPHRHAQKIAKFYYADEKCINEAIIAAVKAQEKWDSTTLAERIKIWERAASLLSKKYRHKLVAATMLGQSKTVVQAEIDAGVELVDFIRMNTIFLKQATNYQPISRDRKITINHSIFRGLEGFVAAISPFNFTAIGANLAYTPALMGNTVLWKPADTAMLSNWHTFNVMREAGVPDGVVNFVPADGVTFAQNVTYSKYLAGLNFTGSSAIFKTIWQLVAKNIEAYKNFPRLVGELGGKNYHFVHESADVDTVVATTIRAAFEYSGQKCSAVSRLYVPQNLWESKIKTSLVERTNELNVGDVCMYESFISAVIDDRAFKRIVEYIEYAIYHEDSQVIAGGKYNNLKGYFIEPTIAVVKDPHNMLMKDEIFGPLLVVYVYKENEIENVMDLIVNTTNYALTGAIFATDTKFLKYCVKKLKMSAGNLYINDKATGAIVGQQPFGGARHSGTNDKAGGPHYILRWSSPQTIKETFKRMTDIYYPYMGICD